MATAEFMSLGINLPPQLKALRFQLGLDIPIPKEFNHRKTAEESRKYTVMIFKSYTKLNLILKRFEAILQKRWLKKSQEHSRKVLLQAWPSMSATHRPDLDVVHLLGRQRVAKAPLQAYLWPYINQEDLIKGPLLLLFLTSRGRNFPDQFFSHDVESASLAHNGWSTEAHEFHHVISPMGKRTPRSYSKLHSPESRDHKSDWLTHRSTIGLVGLEIQSRIYDFLVRCCELILCDLKQPSVMYPSQPPPSFLVPSLLDREWSSLSLTALQAPYRMPQSLDLGRLHQLVSAKCMEQEDHLWLLREDPGYFVACMKEWSEHRTEVVADQHGRVDPIVGQPRFWGSVAHHRLAQSVDDMWFWNIPLAQLEDLMEEFDKVDKLYWSRRLPPKLEHHFQQFECMTSRMINGPLSILKSGFPGSPLMRQNYLRISDTGAEGYAKVKFRNDDRSSSEGRLHMLFEIMQSPQLDFIHGVHSWW